MYTAVPDQWVRSWGSVSVVGDSDDGAVSVVGDSERSLFVPPQPSAKYGQMKDEWPHILKCTESRVGDRGHMGVRGGGRRLVRRRSADEALRTHSIRADTAAPAADTEQADAHASEPYTSVVGRVRLPHTAETPE